jgi:hypothetical protein
MVTLIRKGLWAAKTKHHLSVTSDGDEAVRFLRREGRFAAARRPDLVFLDATAANGRCRTCRKLSGPIRT